MPVERFETLRPDAVLELPTAIDLLIERDDRLEEPAVIAKLERYDHFLRAGRPTPSDTGDVAARSP